MRHESLGERFIKWASQEPTICALTMIGSHARGEKKIGAADCFSDWDFQVVTTKPEMFYNSDWAGACIGNPIAYILRRGRLGSAQKATALLSDGELDAVVIPAKVLRMARLLVCCGFSQRFRIIERGLADLSLTLRGGYRLVKGNVAWGRFFHHVATEIPLRRLRDEELKAAVEGFVCDYVSTHRKIGRGELLAAQRWLHLQLVETNYRLLHELRLREGLDSFHDARRIEALGDPRLSLISPEARLDADSLRNAVEESAAACRELARLLLGSGWQWPDLSTLRLRVE